MAHISIDIQELYKTYWGKKYVIPDEFRSSEEGGDWVIPEKGDYWLDGYDYSTLITDKYQGRNVILPIRFFVANGSEDNMKIPCATIQATRRNTIIRTPVSEREGTVKEYFGTGDWVFNIKGVLIGENGNFPTKDVEKLVEYSKNKSELHLYNGLSTLLLKGADKVVVESLEFPEHQGKHVRFRAFQMTVESDFIDTLKVE
jgi:hypothetical protein